MKLDSVQQIMRESALTPRPAVFSLDRSSTNIFTLSTRGLPRKLHFIFSNDVSTYPATLKLKALVNRVY